MPSETINEAHKVLATAEDSYGNRYEHRADVFPNTHAVVKTHQGGEKLERAAHVHMGSPKYIAHKWSETQKHVSLVNSGKVTYPGVKKMSEETSMLDEELDDKTKFTDARKFREHAKKNGLVFKRSYSTHSGSSTLAHHPDTKVIHGVFHHDWPEGTFSKSGYGKLGEETSMIITHAQNRNAIEFKKALHEKIQERVDAVLAETKVEVASQLMDETKKLGHVTHVTKKPPIKGKPVLPPEKLGEETLDEKVITPGTVEHMAHAVHACHSGECEAHSTRGTFTNYNHPHYHISRDNGSVNPDKHEMNYFVQGAGGMHKFSAEHTKAGIDVKHHGMVG